MREVQVHPPVKRSPQVVRKLQFLTGGQCLAAWVGENGPFGNTDALHLQSLATSSAEVVQVSEWFWDIDERGPDPAVSPDGRFFVAVFDWGDGGSLHCEDLTRPEAERNLPPLPIPECGLCALFTPDGAELLAVRNLEQAGKDEFARDVARFALATYINPPLRVEEKRNPLSGQMYQAPIYNQRWRAGLKLPPGRPVRTAALSADGHYLAAADDAGGVLVADLKRKKVLGAVRRPWPRDIPRIDRRVWRVAVGPGGGWVASLAAGRLFGDPLDGAKRAWRTDAALGPVNDFAPHPSGRFLCAVCADGVARYLDPRTGAVTQAFNWNPRRRKARPLTAVAFAPDGLTCAAGGANGRVVVWDVDV